MTGVRHFVTNSKSGILHIEITFFISLYSRRISDESALCQTQAQIKRCLDTTRSKGANSGAGTRYTYSPSTGRCLPTQGGTGSENEFNSPEECKNECRGTLSMPCIT